MLNISNVARECGVPRKSVGVYLEMLKDLLIAETVPVFTKRAKRQLISHDKFYFFDTGLFRNIRPKGPFDKVSEIDGAALEGLVFQHLKASIVFNGEVDKLCFWRTRSGNEVDFVLYGENGIMAIEVKNNDTVRSKDLAGLKSFKKDYPEAELFLLYRGEDTFVRDDIKVMPCEEYIRDI